MSVETINSEQLKFIMALLNKDIDLIIKFLDNPYFDLSYNYYSSVKFVNANGFDNILELFLKTERFNYEFDLHCLLVDALIRDERNILNVLNKKYKIFPNEENFLNSFSLHSNEILYYVFKNYDYLREPIRYHLQQQKYTKIIKQLNKLSLSENINTF